MTTKTKKELVAGLAATLEVDPDQIMIYTATSSTYAPGYTVILTDHRKFTAVIPSYEIEKPDETALVNVNGVLLPAEYVLYYNNPQDHSRTDLRDLAAYLDIPKARTLNKNPLVKAINDYKVGAVREPSQRRFVNPAPRRALFHCRSIQRTIRLKENQGATMNEPTITTLSLGGGVQSSTIAEMIAVGELPAPDLVLFADTGDEPQYVYDQISYLHGRLESLCDFQTVSAGSLIKDLQTDGKRFAAIPVFTNKNGRSGRMKRQCTSDYKIYPIEKAIREYLIPRGHARRDKRGITLNKNTLIETWLGISLDEVTRMKPARNKRFIHRWPLIELRMTRQDCINWLQDHNLPVPKKSSCRICPYHDNSHWREMRDEYPEDWQHVTAFDLFLRGNSRYAASADGLLYLHRDCIPLDRVDLRPQHEQNGQLPLFDICDEGYCFI